MRYWNFLRKPALRVFFLQLLLFLVSFIIGLYSCTYTESSNLINNSNEGIITFLFMLPALIFGLLLIAGFTNMLFYIKLKITRRKDNKLISSKHFIIIILILIGIMYTLSPKVSGSGGLCDGCKFRSCKCLGYEWNDGIIPGTTKCIGIIYDCTTTTIRF